MSQEHSNSNDLSPETTCILKKPVRVWTGNLNAGTPVQKLIDLAEYFYESWLESRPLLPDSPHVTDEMVGALAQSLCNEATSVGSSDWARNALNAAMSAADFGVADLADGQRLRQLLERASISLARCEGKGRLTLSIEIEDGEADNLPELYLEPTEVEIRQFLDALPVPAKESYLPPLDDPLSAKKAMNTLRRLGYVDRGGRYWVPSSKEA